MHLPELMTLAVERKASDVHIAPNRSPALRLDGSLWPLTGEYPPLTPAETEEALHGILTPTQRQILDRELEIDLAYQLDLPEGITRFRVNMHRQHQGLGAVFRLISDAIPTPEQISLEAPILNLASLPRGLVLLTGATGTGKSTTLACLVDQINQRYRKHVLTIEDPIEYLHKEKLCCITQREVGSHTHAFAPALRSGLRGDPDVILVGEMRDLETIQLALTASETGHLVFSTLHTTDVSQTVDRIIDVFPPGQQQMVRSQLASVLQGVISQVLLPHSSGSGRVAAREIMLATPAIRTLIREQNSHQVYGTVSSSLSAGMCPLELSLAAKVKAGIISEIDALAVANRPKVLQDYLTTRSFPTNIPALIPARDAASTPPPLPVPNNEDW